jgi:hypothetical protein
VVNYAKNFIIQAVQFVVVAGVVFQNASASNKRIYSTISSSIRNLVNSLRKLIFSIKCDSLSLSLS